MNILINPILTLKKLHSTVCEILIDDVFFCYGLEHEHCNLNKPIRSPHIQLPAPRGTYRVNILENKFKLNSYVSFKTIAGNSFIRSGKTANDLKSTCDIICGYSYSDEGLAVDTAYEDLRSRVQSAINAGQVVKIHLI